jgi:hypothetical protein
MVGNGLLSTVATEREAHEVCKVNGARLSKCHPDGRAAIHGQGTERRRVLSAQEVARINRNRWAAVVASVTVNAVLFDPFSFRRNVKVEGGTVTVN